MNSVAHRCQTHPKQMVRFVGWLRDIHGVRLCDLRSHDDKSQDGIRDYIMQAAKGGAA